MSPMNKGNAVADDYFIVTAIGTMGEEKGHKRIFNINGGNGEVDDTVSKATEKLKSYPMAQPCGYLVSEIKQHTGKIIYLKTSGGEV